MIERRAPFIIDEAKFSTQRLVTYFLLIVFAGVTVAVFWQDNQAERSTILQTVINFTLIAVGFWLGSSKAATDKDASMSRIAEASAPANAPIKTDEVKIDAVNATVNEVQPEKGNP